jgi:ribonuclease P/MRP protein subunit POP1
LLLTCACYRYVDGSRICDLHLYEDGCYPYNLIGPASVLWKPIEISDTIDSPRVTDRTLWIRCHPAMFTQAHAAIRKANSSLLQQEKTYTASASNLKAPEKQNIAIADLRGDFNAFEIMGPRSSQVVAGILRLTKECGSETKSFWKTMPGITTPGSISRGMVIGLKVHDPRSRWVVRLSHDVELISIS